MYAWIQTLSVTVVLFGNAASLPELGGKLPGILLTYFCISFLIIPSAPTTTGICNGVCPRIYDPVCGSDEKTYNNECLLNFASCKSGGKIRKVSDGECPIKPPCEDRCPFSKCILGAICVFNPVTCESKCVCNGACPRIYDPVCGSDGRTYNNECLLNFASCKSGGKIGKVSNGKCKTFPPCPSPKPQVCGHASGTFCTEDCRQCCTPRFICEIPMSFTKTLKQCILPIHDGK